MSCGVDRRLGSDPALLWLWYRLVATAPIGPLSWEPPYAVGVAQEMAKRKKKKRKKKNKQFKILPTRSFLVVQRLKDFLLSLLWHGFNPWHGFIPGLGTSTCCGHSPPPKYQLLQNTDQYILNVKRDNSNQ